MSIEDIKVSALSDTQWKAIRFLSRDQCARQVAGYGRAGLMSACGALVRKGLAREGRTGFYALTDEGRELVGEAMKRIPTKEPTP